MLELNMLRVYCSASLYHVPGSTRLYSIIHSKTVFDSLLYKYLSVWYAPGAAQDAGDKAVNKTKFLLMCNQYPAPILGFMSSCARL